MCLRRPLLQSLPSIPREHKKPHSPFWKLQLSGRSPSSRILRLYDKINLKSHLGTNGRSPARSADPPTLQSPSSWDKPVPLSVPKLAKGNTVNNHQPSLENESLPSPEQQVSDTCGSRGSLMPLKLLF